jgi:ferredoxin/flavodoxin
VKTQFVIAYCSPAGSTKHVAEVIGQELIEGRPDVHTVDLGNDRERSRVRDLIAAAGQDICLFVGSPVYRDQAVPPVMEFIEALPDLGGGFAVPFVTWGGAFSGIALWQMARSLTQKGLVLAGAAKVLAVHALLWRSDTPVGKGHPDADDDMAVRNLVQEVLNRVGSGYAGLPLSALDYQLEERALAMKEELTGGARPVIPKSLNEAKCTQCGTCMEECPSDAITMAPWPEFGPSCFDCFNCIRLCPEDAIDPKITLDQLDGMIRKRVETMNERPYTQIFV